MKRVYVCTPLKDEKYPGGTIHQVLLRFPNVFAFIPPTSQIIDKELGAALDKRMIELCNEVWVFGPIGRDCAWEIGYAQGLGKPVVFHLDQTNAQIVNEDWMTFCAGTEIKQI
jgi:hypothetical protein